RPTASALDVAARPLRPTPPLAPSIPPHGPSAGGGRARPIHRRAPSRGRRRSRARFLHRQAPTHGCSASEVELVQSTVELLSWSPASSSLWSPASSPRGHGAGEVELLPEVTG
uniref:Uncharacterized protein n=1 Tax=Oryza glaberrima TaxID=4538 RepID=I1Q3C3_ORYGL